MSEAKVKRYIKVKKFIKEYEKLCKKHGVYLFSQGYETSELDISLIDKDTDPDLFMCDIKYEYGIETEKSRLRLLQLETKKKLEKAKERAEKRRIESILETTNFSKIYEYSSSATDDLALFAIFLQCEIDYAFIPKRLQHKLKWEFGEMDDPIYDKSIAWSFDGDKA